MPMFLVFGIVKSLPSVFFSRGVEKLLTVVCRVIELRVTCGICSELTRYLFGGSNHRLACQRSMCRLLEGCCNVSKHAEVCVCVEREKKSRKLGFWEPGFFYTFFFLVPASSLALAGYSIHLGHFQLFIIDELHQLHFQEWIKYLAPLCIK